MATIGERKLMYYRVAQDLIIDIMTEGWDSETRIKTVKGIPPTATFISSTNYGATGDVLFLFSDDSFGVVELGCSIPIGDPVEVEAVYGGE